MSRNKIIIYLTIIAALLIIAIPTILKVNQNHENRLMLVSTKKILESASNCYYDDVCLNEKITISELREKGYLESDIVNPKTKQYYDDTTVVIRTNNQFKIKEE